MNMKEQIETTYGPLMYTVMRRRGQKYIRISLRRTKGVVVSAPLFVSQKNIVEFVRKHTDWVFENMKQFVSSEIPTQKYFEYIADIEERGKRVYKDSKKEALEILIREVKRVNEIYGFTYQGVKVGNQKTRWGSCSRGGMLSFNYKVAFLPEAQRTYIVAHELSHLKEFNHGPQFWLLVSKVVPEYIQVRAGLKAVIY